MKLLIGPARLADANGTHEPGDMLDNPSVALLKLAAAKTLEPETGLPYCELVLPTPPAAPVSAPAPVVAPTPVTPPADAPAPEKP